MGWIMLRVALADFEKRLLRDFAKTFGGHSADRIIDRKDIIAEVFYRWHWTNAVSRAFNQPFLDEDNPPDESNHDQLWEFFLSRSLSRETWPDGPQHFRIQDLRQSNPNYPQKLATEHCEGIMVDIAEEDYTFWRVITSIFLAVRYNISSFSEPSKFVDLYESRGLEPVECEQLRFKSNGHERPGLLSYPNSPLRQEYVDHWKSDEFEIWSLLRQAAMIERGGRQGDKIWAALDDFRFLELREEPVSTFLVENGIVEDDPLMRLGDHLCSVTEPSTYIEFIPWSDLTMGSPPSIPDWLDTSLQFAFWHPGKASKFDHVMFVNTATYHYLVTLGLTWPYHSHVEKNVNFVLLPLRDSEFLQNYSSSSFWMLWNDCAITQNPDTTEWFLLQTIPGLDYHRVRRDSMKPPDHFAHIMDRMRFGPPQNLHEILGLSYPLRYEQLVNVLPYQSIVSVNAESVGQGARGIVYKAQWECPQLSNMSGPALITVALKAMKKSDPEHLRRFFLELDANLILLRGTSIAGMQFFGVMKTPSRSSGDPQSMSDVRGQSSHLPDDTLFLVSEYATNGSLSDYLDSVLKGNAEDWTVVMDLILSLGSNLWEYHDQNIAHRDLSVNNVLIHVKRSTPGSQSSEVDARISDLGESRRVSDVQPEFPYRQDQEALRGPSHGRYTKESDICFLGHIIAFMVRKVRDVTANGNAKLFVPACIIRWIKWCWDNQERPLFGLVQNMEDDIYLERNEEEPLEMMEVDVDSLIVSEFMTGNSI